MYSPSTATTVRHPIFARLYDRMSRADERHGGAQLRDELIRGTSGSVLEVGAGNGLNFRHYPDAVTSLTALEAEPHLRQRATEAAATADIPVTIVDGTADDLPFPDESFDTVVASLVLCSAPEPAVALAEMRRVLRPDGALRFYEHVAANRPGFARTQRVLDATIWPCLGGGCHSARHTGDAIVAAGFEIIELCRFSRPGFPGDPTDPHIIGAARAAMTAAPSGGQRA